MPSWDDLDMSGRRLLGPADDRFDDAYRPDDADRPDPRDVDRHTRDDDPDDTPALENQDHDDTIHPGAAFADEQEPAPADTATASTDQQLATPTPETTDSSPSPRDGHPEDTPAPDPTREHDHPDTPDDIAPAAETAAERDTPDDPPTGAANEPHDALADAAPDDSRPLEDTQGPGDTASGDLDNTPDTRIPDTPDTPDTPDRRGDDHPGEPVDDTPSARAGGDHAGSPEPSDAEHIAALRRRAETPGDGTPAETGDTPDSSQSPRSADTFLAAEGLGDLASRLPRTVLNRLDTVLADPEHHIERDLTPLAATHHRSCVFLPAPAEGPVTWVCHSDCTAATDGSRHRDLGQNWLNDHIGDQNLDRIRPGGAAIDRVGQLLDQHGHTEVTLERWDGLGPHAESCVRVGRNFVACGTDCTSKQLDTHQKTAVTDVMANLKDAGHTPNPRADWRTVAERAGSWDTADLARSLTPLTDRALHASGCIDVARAVSSCAPDCKLGRTDRGSERAVAAARIGEWRDQAGLHAEVRVTWRGLDHLAERARTWDADALVGRCSTTITAGADWVRNNIDADGPAKVRLDKLDAIGTQLAAGADLRATPWAASEIHTDDCTRLGDVAVCVSCDAPDLGTPQAAVAAAAAAWFDDHPNIRVLPVSPERVEHLTRLVDGDPNRVADTLAEKRSDAWPPSPLDYVATVATHRLAAKFSRTLREHVRHETARFAWQLDHPIQAFRYEVASHPLGQVGHDRLRGWVERPPWLDQNPDDTRTGHNHDVPQRPSAPGSDAADSPDTGVRAEPADRQLDPKVGIGADDASSEGPDTPSEHQHQDRDNRSEVAPDADQEPAAENKTASDASREPIDWGDIDRSDHDLAVAANTSRAVWEPGPAVSDHYIRTGTPLVDRWVATIEAAARPTTDSPAYPGVAPLPVAGPDAFAQMPQHEQATVLRHATVELRRDLIDHARLWHHPLGAHRNETWELYDDQTRTSDAGFWHAFRDLDTAQRAYAFAGSDPLVRARFEYSLRIEAGLIPAPPDPGEDGTVPRLARYDDHTTR